ncbi:MAG: STM4014 family protein [Planctomycetes bacterium]|nr:STM4014 family protein [Planctomycetota bacterium]
MRFVVLGNPEGKRVAFFQRALGVLGQAPAEVLSWIDFLAEPARLAEALAGAVALRIESTGQSFAVLRELIALGAEADLGGAEPLPAEVARGLSEEKGRILCLRQAHEGFRWALDQVRRVVPPSVSIMNGPDAIELMFDKPLCHAACLEAGVPVPPAIRGVQSYADLRAKMAEAGLRRVFVKPAHASSASGVVALATKGEKVAAHTSVELVREGSEVRLYNSRKIRRYGKETDVAAIVDALGPERLHVEAWIPKSKLEGLSCDLRCVVIDGRAKHTVVRTSKTPLTNLHLKNPRGDLPSFQARIGGERWLALQASCEAATAAMGDPLYAGVDVCFTRDLKGHYVLEVNAFGDLLPRVMFEGQDTYGAEISAVLERS